MKREIKYGCLFVLVFFVQINLIAQEWGEAPTGWGPFSFGLTDELAPARNTIITNAKNTPTGIHYRAKYINEGVNITTNWYSSLPGGGLATNTINMSEAIGMRGAFNIYMLQEDGGADVAIANMNNLTFMQQYFWNIRDVAQKANGHKCVFIIEPDTWGYLIKKNYGNGPTSAGGNASIRPSLVFCNVNNLGYTELSTLPNTMAGMAQGIIKMIRAHAPDAYIGFHTNHWAAWSNGATGAYFLGSWSGAIYQGQAGMPFWNYSDIDVNLNFQIAWYNELFGGSGACDKGDFIVVEKYGQDEGARWAIHPSGNVLYYGATQYQKWLYWSKKMGQGLNLPILGWQIPIGVSTLPNTLTANAACLNGWNYQYKDGFMEYFFANYQDFICSGFIGLFMGPGVGQTTSYYNTGSPCGDQGYLFGNIRSVIDPLQNMNMTLTSIPACSVNSTSPTCVPLGIEELLLKGKRKNTDDVLTLVGNQKVEILSIEESKNGLHFMEIHSDIWKTKEAPYHLYRPGNGIMYYRMAVLIDRKRQYTNVVAIHANEIATIQMYPNPGNGTAYFMGLDTDQTYTLRILSSEGKEIRTIKIENNYAELIGLTSGLYMAEVVTDAAESGTWIKYVHHVD